MAPVRIRRMSSEDAAYLAGLIDGEVTISLSRRHSNERRQLVVSVSSTEICILDWVYAAVGAGKITRKRVVSPLHAPGLTYAVSNRQALALLEKVSPYLRSYKKKRADLELDQYLPLTPRNGKYSKRLLIERAVFEQTFAKITARVQATIAVAAPEDS
jgi:hypothetical protein